MARFVSCIAVFAALCLIPVLVEADSEEIPRLQTPEEDDTSLTSSNYIIQLILTSKNTNGPCDSELNMCGIHMCVVEIIGNSEEGEIGSQPQITVTGTNENRVSDEDEKCFCGNKEAEVHIKKEIMKVADQHVVEYRVQEESRNVREAELCNWKLTVFTKIPDEDETSDVIGCISRNTCMVVCHVRSSKLLKGANYAMFHVITALLCIALVLPWIVIKCWMKTRKASFDVESRRLGKNVQEQKRDLPSSSAFNTHNNEDNMSTDAGNTAETYKRNGQRFYSAADAADRYEEFLHRSLLSHRIPRIRHDYYGEYLRLKRNRI